MLGSKLTPVAVSCKLAFEYAERVVKLRHLHDNNGETPSQRRRRHAIYRFCRARLLEFLGSEERARRLWVNDWCAQSTHPSHWSTIACSGLLGWGSFVPAGALIVGAGLESTLRACG